MKQIRLSKRLNVIAGMVTDGHRLADVGCDHAWLPAFLVSQGRIPSALAMDVAEGPLERAAQHIREYHLQDRIQTRLSDGLEELNAQEADTLVISGMGGNLILRILSAKPELIRQMPELILSPQSEVERVRRWLFRQGFVFLDEELVCEDEKWYFIMKVSAQAGRKAPYPPAGSKQEELLYSAFGPVLLNRRDPVLGEWLDWQMSMLEKIQEHLRVSGRGALAEARRQEITLQLEQIDQARMWMKSAVNRK